MRERILGIDVGSYSIKVAEIERSLRSFELVGFYEQPIPAATEGTGGETIALQRLFEEYNLGGESLYTALPGQKTAFRLIDLPFSNFKKIDTTIEFEMENYLPLPLDEVVVDYKILASDKTHSRVMVSYARKGELIKFLNLFAGAELDPRFVGAESVEGANLLSLGVITPEGAFVLMEIGHEKMNLCFFVGGELQAARTIMVGGKDLTRAIAASLKIPETEAERIKLEMGQVGEAAEAADPMTRQVTEAMQVPLGDLLVQIKQTLLAFQEDRGEVIQAILLTGGTSRLAGIDQYFSKNLRKNVGFLDPLDIASNRLSDSQWCRSIAAPALALATRGVIGARSSDLQFRRGEFAYRGEVRDLKSLVREVAVQAGAITAVVLVTFFVSFFGLHAKLSNQEQRLATVASGTLPELPKKSLTNPKNVISILSGRVSEVTEKQRRLSEEVAVSVLGILQEVSAPLPARDSLQIDVDDLTIAAGRIRMSGRTNSFEAVDQIKTALAKSAFFQNVATENVRKGTADQIKFDISLEIKGEEEGRGT